MRLTTLRFVPHWRAPYHTGIKTHNLNNVVGRIGVGFEVGLEVG
jgi:hypothetical protein